MDKKQTMINLESLLELSGRLNDEAETEFILNSALLTLMGKLKILSGCIIVPDENGYRIALHKGRKPENIKNIDSFRFSDIQEAEKYFAKTGFKYFIPVLYSDETLAIVCLGNKLAGQQITEIEEYYASLVCTITANALQNARNLQSLREEKLKAEKRIQLLDTLFDIGRDFSGILSKDRILQTLRLNLMGQMVISRYCIISFKEEDEFEIIENRFRGDFTDDMVKELSKVINPVLSGEVEFSSELTRKIEENNIKIISPMKVQGVTKGTLLVGGSSVKKIFGQEEVSFIESLGNIAILALENERLFKEEVEKKRLDSELKMARGIQQNLFPKIIPEISGYQLDGRSNPSSDVGGDYYDFIQLDDGRLILAIADVSGKGMPASLLMANVQAALRVLSPLGLELPDIVARINKVIYDNTTADKFLTFFIGMLDPETGNFQYVNAGHNPPLFRYSSGEYKKLDVGGLLLGIMDDFETYLEDEITLNPGDSIYLFTDGVTEAQDSNRTEYGEDRLEKFYSDNHDQAPEEFIDRLMTDIFNFAGDAPQYDDITCIMIKREE